MNIYSDEELKEYNRLSILDRLKWLEDTVILKWLLKRNIKNEKNQENISLYEDII